MGELTGGPAPQDKGSAGTWVIGKEMDSHSESHAINKRGIDDTDESIYRSLPQLGAHRGPDESLLSNLFIDQCLNVINSWFVN